MGFRDRLKALQEGVGDYMEQQRAAEAEWAAKMPPSPPPPLLPGAAPEEELVRLAADAERMRAEVEAGTRERPAPRAGWARGHVTTKAPVDPGRYALARAIVVNADVSTAGDTKATLSLRVRRPGGTYGPREVADCFIGRKPARLLAPGLDVPVLLDPLDGTVQHVDVDRLTEESRPRFGEVRDRDAVLEPIRDIGHEAGNAASAARDLSRWVRRKWNRLRSSRGAPRARGGRRSLRSAS